MGHSAARPMRLAWLRRVGGSSSRSRPGGCSARRRPPSQEATRPGAGPGQEAAHHRRGSRPPWPRPRPGGHPHRRRPRPGSRPRHGGRADGRRSCGWRALSAVATSPSSRVRACSRSVKPAGARQGRPGALRPQAAASPARPPPTGGGGGSLLLRSAHLRGGVVQEQTARRPSAATATMDAGHDELSYHLRQEVRFPPMHPTPLHLPP